MSIESRWNERKLAKVALPDERACRTTRTIQSVPQHPVVVFDGECHLCHAWVAFVIRHDVAGSFRFAARKSEAAKRVLEAVGVQPDALTSIALVVRRTLHTRSDAVLHVCKALGFPWNLLVGLSVIPRPLRDFGYSVLARNRYRLSGQHDRSRVPDPEVEARVLR